MRTVSFQFGEKDVVKIDGDDSIRAVVIASAIRGENKTHQVSWMDGGARNEWIEEWRLSLWEA